MQGNEVDLIVAGFTALIEDCEMARTRVYTELARQQRRIDDNNAKCRELLSELTVALSSVVGEPTDGRARLERRVRARDLLSVVADRPSDVG